MRWRVSKEEKLIAFLQSRLGDYSGKYLRKVLEANCCRINGHVERFGSRLICRGDNIELAPQWESLSIPKRTFDTLYENDSLKIINKPSGWVCEPKNVEKGFFLVHRLDKDTTGALILAKSQKVRDTLFDLFEKRQVQKTYLAIVDGIPKQDGGDIRSSLIKKGSFQGQTIWGSGSGGLSAITKWKKLEEKGSASLISLEPETGRTHQLRVHMAEMGHPILIDRQYAKSFRCPLFAQRIMLHASRLQLIFEEKQIDVTAPLFLDMRDFLRDIGVQMGHLGQFFSKEEQDERGD